MQVTTVGEEIVYNPRLTKDEVVSLAMFPFFDGDMLSILVMRKAQFFLKDEIQPLA